VLPFVIGEERKLLRASVLFMLCFGPQVRAQPPSSPIPDTITLLKQVQTQQHKMDEVRDNYTFHCIRQVEARVLVVKSFRQNVHVKDFDFKRFDVGTAQRIGPLR
jgi:hypothetical protein